MLEQNNQGLNAKELIALSKGPAPYYLGTSSPQVLIVEYGDFNCSHCRVVSPTIRKVVSQNKDIVQYVWRDWPGQNNSELLAQAARCAGEQAGSLGFWLFHDQLLLNQSQFTTTSQLMDLAQEYSLSDTKLKDCLDQQRTLGYLQKDYQDAIALGGIAGTPTWFINGYRFSGELPAEFFNYMIKELTKNK
jgi:protein-disulfide isomerase